MSRLATGIYGAIALSLTLGAAQLASGRDLSDASPQDRLQQDRLQNAFQQPLIAGLTAVNRAAKADRATAVAGSPARTQTIALRLESFSDTSFLVRVPVANAADNALSVPSPIEPTHKMMLACEPSVSVLTEVAKRLQPGRCVT